jgi:signal transduction histidine kinase
MEEAVGSEVSGAYRVLVAEIAHDLNNLLFGIHGCVLLAREKLPADGTGGGGELDDALRALENARGLRDRLLRLSSSSAFEMRAESLLEPLQASARFVFAGAATPPVLDLSPDLWPCDVDLLQIRRVFDNLLINARQASPADLPVSVLARNVELLVGAPLGLAPGRYVELTIVNLGEVIPTELRARIFEPFFSTKETGSGLGLPIARSIVLQHGGGISFESEPRRGTTFRVVLRASPSLRRTTAD